MDWGKTKQVKERFDNCPYCGHDWAWQEDITIDNNSLYLDYTCSKCRKSWQEAWTFQDTTIEEE